MASDIARRAAEELTAMFPFKPFAEDQIVDTQAIIDRAIAESVEPVKEYNDLLAKSMAVQQADEERDAREIARLRAEVERLRAEPMAAKSVDTTKALFKDRKPGKGTGRHIACFILRG